MYSKLLQLVAILLLSTSTYSQTLTSNLPIVIIKTKNGYVVDEPKVEATAKIINKSILPNSSTDTPTDYDGKIGIEIRGSSSQWYDKKNYDIELVNADGSNNNVSVLGLPKENDFALIQALNDKTLMRDALAHLLAQESIGYSPRGKYCEVILDGDYKGVYLFTETIKRDKNRVDIEEAESSEDDKFGFILKVDKFNQGTGGDFTSTIDVNLNFQYHYPKPQNITQDQATYIQNYIHDFENMLAGSDYKTKYPQWIDVDSWINYLLVNEISKNTDGYRISSYFYKDENSKLVMGPLWDFNIAFGIGDYCGGNAPEGWSKDFNLVCPDDGFQVPYWWKKVWDDNNFRLKTAQRWKQLRQTTWTKEAIYHKIDSIATLLNSAKSRNFSRWPVLGIYVWPNAFIGQTYTSEVAYLKDWLQRRIQWMDGQFNLIVNSEATPENKKFGIYPTPNDGNFTVNAEIREKDVMEVYDVHGQLKLKQNLEEHSTVIHLKDQLSSGLYYLLLRSPSTSIIMSAPLLIEK